MDILGKRSGDICDTKEILSLVTESDVNAKKSKELALQSRYKLEDLQSDYDKCINDIKFNNETISEECLRVINRYVHAYNGFARMWNIPSCYLSFYSDIYKDYNKFVSKYTGERMYFPGNYVRKE